MKLFLTVLLSALSYHCCVGYPVVDGKLPEDFLLGHENSIDSWPDTSNETSFNNSLSFRMQGLGRNFLSKVLKIVKDEVVKVQGFLLENRTSIEYWFDSSKETASNEFSPLDLHGFGKKVVEKVKDGIKTVKDKVKDAFDTVKNKIKDFKDKIGSKVGSGGGYYKDKYDRDYDRDRYDRDSDYSGVNWSSDPDAKWYGLGIGIFMIVGILIVLVYYKVKGDI